MEAHRCFDGPSVALLRGIAEFNRGMFFEQHETLEEAWIEESDPIRYLYQGILQIGVAFYHLKRGNFIGATHLMQRGMQHLAPFSPVCMDVDVDRLLRDTEQAYRALLACGPGALSRFDQSLTPSVHLISAQNAAVERDL